MPKFVDGGVTAAAGFRAAGIHAGLKKREKPDLALLVPDEPCPAAGVFTRNRVQAHPVVDSRRKLRGGHQVSAVLVNSGGANACTGPEGMKDLKAILAALARRMGVPSAGLLMASTGVIGERLPVERVLSGIPGLLQALSPAGHHEAARAIMTTDTVPKECAVIVDTPDGPLTVGGMAKGSGMIAPNMATMLAFITTDGLWRDRSNTGLKAALAAAADSTFNRVEGDGDTSTNDTLLLLAGGKSGVDLAKHREPFAEGLLAVCESLAVAIARDIEGATKLVTVIVRGARSDGQAHRAARTVAQSLLVKTAIHGEDPNWGRIMGALGRSGATFSPDRVGVTVNRVPLVIGGVKNVAVTEEAARAALTPTEVVLEIVLGDGAGEDRLWTSDLTADYIRINASYRS